jgi:ferrochelatase
MGLVAADISPYDALLLVSFGGPEAPEDVVPFLENVTRGRGIPAERLEEVGTHYFARGGRSPINDANRDLLTAVQAELTDHDIDLPLYWGNRNWDPFLTETLQQMAADGVTRAACFTTSAYSSYSSCRQYREDLAAASTSVGAGAPRLDKLRLYFNHPGFLEPIVDAVVSAIAGMDADDEELSLVFVTHSIPTSMNDASGRVRGAYLRQHRSVAAWVTERVAERLGGAGGRDLAHDLVFCSRSGAPQVPWLEPDVNDHLAALKDEGVGAVVLIPIGFVSDHMEVVHDLDTEALETARELGLRAVRVPTSGTDPRFAAMVRELLVERAAAERGETVTRVAVGSEPPSTDLCAVGCCANPRGELPVVSGQGAKG